MNKFTFWCGSVIAIIVLAFSITGTAFSMDKGISGKSAYESYYRELEKEYVRNVKSILCKNGYDNAGVMLTKTIDADGQREYVVSIHHRKLDIESARTQKVISDIDSMVLDVESATKTVILN